MTGLSFTGRTSGVHARLVSTGPGSGAVTVRADEAASFAWALGAAVELDGLPVPPERRGGLSWLLESEELADGSLAVLVRCGPRPGSRALCGELQFEEGEVAALAGLDVERFVARGPLLVLLRPERFA